VPCPPGTFSPVAGDACTECPDGEFQDGFGQTTVKIFANYEKIFLKFVVFSIALARQDTILSIVGDYSYKIGIKRLSF
jgi:hypothetical protein